MLQMIMTFLGQLAVRREILTLATKFGKAVKQSCETKFTTANSQLKNLSSEIEEALQDKNEKGLQAKLAEANACNEKLKSDLQAFRVIHRTLYPRAKAPKQPKS